MTIHKAGDCGIAMLIDRQELKSLGISWEQIDDQLALQWVYDALAAIGATAAPVSVEAFQHNGAILIFAILPSEPTFFRFDCFESLLDAVQAIAAPESPTDVYALGHGYILALHSGASPQWHEFAHQWRGTIAYLNEHGKLLLQNNAVERLRDVFTKT